MVRNINTLESNHKRSLSLKKQKLNQENAQILQQCEDRNSKRRRQKSDTLREELRKAMNLRNQLDSEKKKEYLKGKLRKEREYKEVKTQIDMKKRVKNLEDEGDRKEDDNMINHEFDLFGKNQIRHHAKLSSIMHRNERIRFQNSKYAGFKEKDPSGVNTTYEGSNSLLLKQGPQDLTAQQRSQRNKEILKTYKKQILEKEHKKKNLNGKRMVERFIFDKNSEISPHYEEQERKEDLKKKAKLKKDLDTQIRKKRQDQKEDLLSVYI